MAAACSDEGETSRITKGIENAVKQHFKESDADSLTVNGIRSRAEVDLSLDKGFLRTDTFWRDRSKIIIRDEFVSEIFCCQYLAQSSPSSPVQSSPES